MTPDELRRRFAARLTNAGVVFGQGTHDAESDAALLVDGYLLGHGAANEGTLPAGAGPLLPREDAPLERVELVAPQRLRRR